jgi:DNA polymerase lambda
VNIHRLLPGAKCNACGSYRRGKPTSGDIDILICPPDDMETLDLLPQLIEDLSRDGLLTDHLTLPSTGVGHMREKGRASYMGICKLPEPGSLHRRIDIKVFSHYIFLSCVSHGFL